MEDGPIIYEVRLEIRPEIAPEFDAWLHGHVEAMLQLPGFEGARLLEEEQNDPALPDAPVVRTVQYDLESRSALDAYIRDHAPRMRQAGIDRFGDRFVATRRVLSPTQTVARVSPAASACQNCGTALTGQYCVQCGQRVKSRMISLWELLRDFVGDLFELDSRLWRSLFPLIMRPGLLTREYLRGRRVHYTPPLRMYLVLSLLFFVTVTFPGVEGALEIDGDQPEAGEAAAGPGAEVPDTAPAGDEEQSTGDGDEAELRAVVADVQDRCEIPDYETGWLLLDSPAVKARLQRVCERIAADQGRAFLRALVDNIPKMLFLFLPLIALVLKILYLGSRRYYVEHLLFVVHFHSFFFLALTITVLSARVPSPFPGWGVVVGLLIATMVIYPPIYLFRAMRVVYGQGRTVTLIKYVLLNGAYLLSLMVTFLVGVVVTALSV